MVQRDPIITNISDSGPTPYNTLIIRRTSPSELRHSKQEHGHGWKYLIEAQDELLGMTDIESAIR